MLRLDEFIPYRLSVASNAVSELIASAYRQRFGITITEWRTIAILGEGTPLAPREIGRRARMDKVAVSRAAKALEDRGLVERSPNDDDQRSHRLRLTEQGRALYETVGPQALTIEAELFRDFEPWERAALASFLARAQAAAEACAI